MSTFYGSNYTKITSKNQLLEKFFKACKPSTSFQIGLEVEKLAVDSHHNPIPYRASKGPSIEKILFFLKDALGGEEIQEGGNVIALHVPEGMISLEPGGQIEYSMAPCFTISEMDKILQRFLQLLKQISQEMGVCWINLGFHPQIPLEEMPWMPKARYNIMKKYLPQKARLPLEMMTQTASLQVSLDYESEEDMVEKFRLSQALNPVLIGMYANSPFKNGKFTGYHSYRTYVWDHVDPERCGLIREVFEPHFSFEKYVDFLLDVPMMFLLRGENWIFTQGLSFQKFWEEGFQGEEATLGDWDLHGTGVFTEIRLRPWMEIRTPDLPENELILSYPTFLKGLLYDSASRKEAWDILGQPKFEEILEGRKEASEKSLEAFYRGVSLPELALNLVSLSSRGLLHQGHPEEIVYLEKLKEKISKKKSPAMEVLERQTSSEKMKCLCCCCNPV